MKIGLVGYGAMNQAVAAQARAAGHEVAVIIAPHSDAATHQAVTAEALAGLDVVIEHAQADGLADRVAVYAATGVPVCVGTTGWYDMMDEMKVQAAGATVLWSSNFSLGVHFFFNIVRDAARLANKLEQYDVWGTELHHNQKADSPSGTAKTLSEILLSEIERKTSVVEEKLDRAIAPEEIHFSSTRGGAVNFSHTIGFDAPEDTITVTHSARNRDGYARGAVAAAAWLTQQKAGWYSMEDFLSETFDA